MAFRPLYVELPKLTEGVQKLKWAKHNMAKFCMYYVDSGRTSKRYETYATYGYDVIDYQNDLNLPCSSHV